MQPCFLTADKEESVEQFIRRNLGAEVFERLIEPFCSGVYAGDPSKLSMQAAFQRVSGSSSSSGSSNGSSGSGRSGSSSSSSSCSSGGSRGSEGLGLWGVMQRQQQQRESSSGE